MATKLQCAFLALFCLKSAFCQRDVIHVVFNNTFQYDEGYELVLNNTVEYILEFHDKLGLYESEFPARVQVSSQDVNRTYPIFITARQQKGILSWQLPLLVETQERTLEFKNISRTLCPNKNFFMEEAKSCRSAHIMEDDQNSPILHMTTSSPHNQIVQFKMELVHDFYVHIEELYNVTVSPSEPKYHYYSFAHGVTPPGTDLDIIKATYKHVCNVPLTKTEIAKIKYFAESKNLIEKGADVMIGASTSVLTAVSKVLYPHLMDITRMETVVVVIESDDDVCMMISIQNASCPVFDTEREILYEGFYATISRRGAITVPKDDYPDGFYIVYIIKSSDEDCIGRQESKNESSFFDWNQPHYGMVDYFTVNSGRVKNLTFRVVPSISRRDYVIATTVFIGAFIGIYFIFLFGILCCSRRYNKSYNEAQMQQNCEDATPNTSRYGQDVIIPSAHAPVTISGSNPDSLIVHSGSPRSRPSSLHTENVLAPPAYDDHGFAQTTRNDSDPFAAANPTIINARGDSIREDTVSSSNRHNAVTASIADESDSSIDSDAKSEYSTLDDANTDKEIYRQPGILTLAHLAKRKQKVLVSRSYLYFYNVLTVAVFYGLPVVQLVVTYQRVLNQTGNQDLCYYNFLCAHPLGLLSDFNHVFSNMGYILLGLLFMLLVWRRAVLQKRRENLQDCGIPQHFGLFYAMGFALIMEGVLSASYHVCPNHSNFQFDTSFMYIMAVLIMVKIYQTRHPDINARAHTTFGVLACLIFMGFIGVMYSNFYVWVFFTILHILACFTLTFQIYYMGRFKRDVKVLYRVLKVWFLVDLRTSPREAVRPKYVTRLVLLILANLANWAFAAYGVYRHEKDFATHLLMVLMANSLLYTLFYIAMKLVHREKIVFYSWLFNFAAFSCWFGALYFFYSNSTSWALTPAQSRTFNKKCILMNFYDPHDVWHALSAGAMFFSFLLLLTLDDGMSRTPRCRIPVF